MYEFHLQICSKRLIKRISLIFYRASGNWNNSNVQSGTGHQQVVILRLLKIRLSTAEWKLLLRSGKQKIIQVEGEA